MRNIKGEIMETCEMKYTKAMRTVIAKRKRDRDELAEHEAIVDMYESALGMA